MEKKLHINPIDNRQYVLSPAIQSGNDRECVNKDFYQEAENSAVYVGKLGMGMKVVHRKTNIPYTIIHFEKEKVAKMNLQKKLNSTIDLMYKSSHPYLFRLLNHFETHDHVFMIFESYDGDSLDNKIINGKCDLQNSLKYLVEVMLAIQHMHSFNLFNLNVNPENILISECIKLTDYALRLEGRNDKPKRKTIYKKKGKINYLINSYTSPETLNAILNGTPCMLNGKTDSWNCGILLYEMLTSFKTPFKGETDEEFIDSILNCNIDLSLIKDNFCRDLISKLLKKNPEDRISIDEVLMMDYIKNIDIEQPEIDFCDNIINPIDENEFNNKPNKDIKDNKEIIDKDKTHEYYKKMQNLKYENDSLKKMVEELTKKANSSVKRKKISKHTAKLKSMVIEPGGEIIADENEVQNLGELLNEDENNSNDNKQKEKSDNKESKIEEIKKGIKNEIIEEEDDDEEEEFSETEEEFDDENLYIRCEKYKQRGIELKEKLVKIVKKNKYLKNLADQYKKENDVLKSEKNKNILETLAKMNTVPIYQINDLVNVILNSINVFKSSQNDFKKSIDKLVNLSDDNYTKLSEENKKYIDSKAKLFLDIMNNKISDVEAYKTLNTNKEEDKKNKNDQKQNNIINDNNNINLTNKGDDFKKKYENQINQEKLLNKRIQELEKKVKEKDELNKVEKLNKEQITNKLNEVANDMMSLKMKLAELKKFIEDNVDPEKRKNILEDIQL